MKVNAKAARVIIAVGARRLGRQGHFRAGQVHRAGAERARVLRVQGIRGLADCRRQPDRRRVAVILANPVMIEAYRSGVPGNGKPFPDGAKIAKIHWKPKKSAEAPAPTTVPDTLQDVDFMVKDSKRFPDSGGWGYAQFDYDPRPIRSRPTGAAPAAGPRAIRSWRRRTTFSLRIGSGERDAVPAALLIDRFRPAGPLGSY